MIVVEISIRRERPRPARGEPIDPVALATALRPRRGREARWVWRLGQRGIAAALASVCAVASMALVPGSDAPEASTLHMVPRLQAADAAPDTAPAHAASSREIERMARDFTAAALERVRAREGAGSPAMPFAGLAQEADDFGDVSLAVSPLAAPTAIAQPSPVTEMATDAVARSEHARQAPATGRSSGLAPSAAEHVTHVGRSARARGNTTASRADDAGTGVAADDPESQGSVAEPEGTASAATDGAPAVERAAAAAAPLVVRSTTPSFSITRDRSAETQDLVLDLHERASRADWAGVRDLLARLRASPGGGAAASDPTIALTLAKWDARLALQAGDADAAVRVLASVPVELDDEARALQAVAWLRTGAAEQAVAAYRDLLVRRPDDARLWLGLGMALESAAADAAAVRYAYSQTVALARDAGVRAAAEARLATPKA